MKKILLISTLASGVAFAAPSITGSGVTLNPGSSGQYTFDYVGFADDVAAATVRFDFSGLPGDVTVDSVSSSNAAVFACSESAKIVSCAISTDQFDSSFNPLPIADTTSFLTVELSAAAGASDATYNLSTTQLDFQNTTGADIAGGAANLGDVVIQAATTTFSTTVNYSVDPASTGSGGFACEAPAGTALASGASAAGGTTVSCTATPASGVTSVISGCPAGATTSNNTSCVFDASTTATETVTLSARFTSGSGTTDPVLTATAGANGTVSCTPSGNVASGTSVTCTATPATNFVVNTWSAPSACTGNTCTFNMPSTDTAVSVSFRSNQVTPVDPARPVPALGVFGLLAMLASLFGAATMVLRRKQS